MAEGGDLQRNINLCQNQEEKVVEGKSIEERSGFPELAMSEIHGSSAPHGLVNGCRISTLDPVHQHSRRSETELKDILEKAPLLTPSPSELDVNQRVDHVPKSDSSAKVSNIDPAPPCPLMADHAAGEQSLPTGAGKASQPEEPGEAGEISFASSYLRAAVINPSSLEASSPSTLANPSSSSFLPSQDEQVSFKNDLSGSRHAPPPPPILPMMGPPGFGSIMGGVMPVMYCPMIPMSYDPRTNQPVMNPPMFASQPFTYPMAQSTGQTTNQHMTPNISCGYMGNDRATGGNGAAGGNKVIDENGVTGGSPLTATFGGYGSQQTLDSRNIPVNGSVPSSEENISGGSRSYSLNPGKDTRLTRLREPVLQWIRQKLDRHCRNNWEAVADVRGWNYEEIRDHLSDCRHSRDSPFLKLLDTETFCTYTVQDFMGDMRRIGRKDILMDFDEVLQNNRS